MKEAKDRALSAGQVCPVCDEGVLTRVVGPETYDYKGCLKTVDIEKFDCPHCGESFLDHVSMAAVEPALRCWRAAIDAEGSTLQDSQRRLLGKQCVYRV